MDKDKIPKWILDLDLEDIEFVCKFILNSGSLKNVAKEYKVSYPTVRLKLNRLIQSIELSNNNQESLELVNFIKKLAIDDEITLNAAQKIIEKCKSERNNL